MKHLHDNDETSIVSYTSMILYSQTSLTLKKDSNTSEPYTRYNQADEKSDKLRPENKSYYRKKKDHFYKYQCIHI